jgi:hypothetical protein
MGIAGHAIFVVGLSLNLLLVWRCLKTRQVRSYPFFFCYVFYTFLRDAVLSTRFLRQYGGYAKIFWLCYMGETLLWFAVGWEVFRQTFPGGSVMRRIASRALVCALLLLGLIFYLTGTPPGSHLIADFVRKIALSVAVWLLLVWALARYYEVAVGRNVWGMGNGLLALVSSHISNFAAIDISSRFEPVWSLLQPFVFTVSLAFWTVTMWSYAPNPKPIGLSETLQQEALSYWQERWVALETTIRKAIKP